MIKILFEDAWFLAVHKPGGLPVHHSKLVSRGEPVLLQALRVQTGVYLYPIHRLDRPTSGVIVFAKSPESAGRLQHLIQNDNVEKTYDVICRGWFSQNAFECDYPLRRLKTSLSKSSVNVQRARTTFHVVDIWEHPWSNKKHASSRFSLLEASPQTGRTHQIRRHLAHLHHPVIGDTTYGDGTQNRIARDNVQFAGLCLHARELGFIHPFTGVKILISSANDWLHYWTKLLRVQ